MTPPRDPLNPRPKSPNSSRKSMDLADALLKTELTDNGDGRWKYRPHETTWEMQTDATIALRAGCNESYVARTRRDNYGPCVPQQSMEARAAKSARAKERGLEPPKLIAPNLEAPPPPPLSLEQRVMQHATAINRNANIQAGHTEALKQSLDRLAVLEAHMRELREGLGLTV